MSGKKLGKILISGSSQSAKFTLTPPIERGVATPLSMSTSSKGYPQVNLFVFSQGRLMEPLKNADRTVDWKLSAEEVACRVRMSDSSPGAIATLLLKENGKTYGYEFFSFKLYIIAQK